MTQLSPAAIQTDPFGWAEIGGLYSPEDAAALASSYPHNDFKTLSDTGGEKVFEYEARSLISMGADTVSHPEELSDAWLTLARDLCSPAYRAAISRLIGCDLSASLLEVNVFHYGPGSSLGAHRDLATKIVTHVLYFNPWWDVKQGGCLNILRSSDPTDIAAVIEPIVGNSAIIVRSENSWHAVSRVVDGCSWSRRSLTATFYHPGSPSTMWPLDDAAPLHRFDIADM
ncbi:MAG: 2OG-Fe(II) oxygenase [Chloroflexota bacterium]